MLGNFSQEINISKRKDFRKRDTHPRPQSQDTPTNQARSSIIQVPAKLLNQKHNRRAQPADSPSHKTRKQQNRTERQCLFPCWPVQRIVDVVARLGNQDYVCIALVFELVGRCKWRLAIWEQTAGCRRCKVTGKE